MIREIEHLQLARIRTDAMQKTMRDTASVDELAERLGISAYAVCAMLVLKMDGFTDADDELRYAAYCKLPSQKIEDALIHCIADKTLQPLKMLYAETGGGTE